MRRHVENGIKQKRNYISKSKVKNYKCQLCKFVLLNKDTGVQTKCMLPDKFHPEYRIIVSRNGVCINFVKKKED